MPTTTHSFFASGSKEDLKRGSNYVSRGQRRIDFIMLFIGMCLLFLCLPYMTKKIPFHTRASEAVEVLSSFWEYLFSMVNKDGVCSKFFFFPLAKHGCWKAPLGNVCVALLTMKCRELKINFIEIINALPSVEDQLVEINTTDYCWIMHTNVDNILGNKFRKINNNYPNRDLLLKFPYISWILNRTVFQLANRVVPV